MRATRITRKKENGFYVLEKGREIYGEENGIRLVQIVGMTEDIEEELGIGLYTLFLALKNGIYVVMYKGQEPFKIGGLELSLKDKALNYHWSSLDMCGYASGTSKYYFKDYGVTWALDKREIR